MTSGRTPTPHGADRRHATALHMERVIGALLRVGVSLSLAIVIVGTVLIFVDHPDYVTSSHTLKPLLSADQATFPHSLVDLSIWLAASTGRAIATAGLLLLIATPVLRVLVSAVVFLYRRDRIYSLITISVLILLLISFLVGYGSK